MTIFSRFLDNNENLNIHNCEDLLFVYGEYSEMANDISNDNGRTISSASLIMLLHQMNERIYELESEIRNLKGE